MIHHEAWHREADEKAIDTLKRKVEHRDLDSVLPYVKALLGTPLLNQPHPELAWLLPLGEALQRKIVRSFEEALSVGSLLGKTEYQDRENLPLIYGNARRAVDVVQDLVKGGRAPEWTLRAMGDLLEYTRDLPGLAQRFQEALDLAIEERDKHPDAQEFQEDLDDELDWVRERLKELEQYEVWASKINSSPITLYVDEEDDPEEFEVAENNGQIEAGEDLSQAENSFDYLGEILHSELGHLHTHGYPGPAGQLSEDGHFSHQWYEMERHFNNARYWIQAQPEYYDLIREIFE